MTASLLPREAWGMESDLRFNDAVYQVAEVIETGLTSRVYRTTDGAIVKQYRSGIPVSKFEREVHWLNRLRHTGVVPELLAIDNASRALLMNDAGATISSDNAPPDWDTQLAGIMDALRSNHCRHNDLSEKAILVRDGRLRVIDFGSATEAIRDDYFQLPMRKGRNYLDDYIGNYIRFKLFGAPLGAEPHCFVLWNTAEHRAVRAAIEQKFEVVRGILYTPSFFKNDRQRKIILDRFYCGKPADHGQKGQTPFLLLFVLDRRPVYGTRHDLNRKTQDYVNTNVFDAKAELRKGRTGFLHASDSILECFDNLDALTTQPDGAPRSYWLHWRPTFPSVDAFFSRLNETSELKYVVLRDFDGLLGNSAKQYSDIDILVNDFYLFKRVSGAIGYKHKRPKGAGPALEHGGYKVAGRVSIGGDEVSVDIRFIGDGYYCDAWEKDILARRVRRGRLNVPDPENLFYSFLYHALVHKRRLSEHRDRTIREMAPGVGLDLQPECGLAGSERQLWATLDAFIAAKQYQYVRPSELSIALSAEAKRRMGITAQMDLDAAAKYLEGHKPLHARHLLLGVIMDEPRSRVASRLLKVAERRSASPGTSDSSVLAQLKRLVPVGIKQPLKRLMFWQDRISAK